MLRRLTPSPTDNTTTSLTSITGPNQYLIGLRPRSVQDQIVESLEHNELPLVGTGLDARIIQRLTSENPSTREELVGLSLANYRTHTTPEALLNYILRRVQDDELTALIEVLEKISIDNSVLGELLNLMRLTKSRDPIPFLSLLERSAFGFHHLRQFLQGVDLSTSNTLQRLITLSTQTVSPGLIEAVEANELAERQRIEQRAIDIEETAVERINRIIENSNIRTFIYNTSVGAGVTGLLYVGYRAGLWDVVINYLSTTSANRPLQQQDQTFLDSMKILLAGTSGFLLKRGLFRR